MTTPLLNGLNEPQNQAVVSENQHLLILAGAGSGKTRALTHRIAYLVETGLAAPHSILAVTFTNKAAKEMRLRVDGLLSHPPKGMWIGTFHGLAHRLLKAHWQDAGLPQNFQVMDSEDQLRLVKRVMTELGLDEGEIPPKTAQWFINEQKDEGRRAHHLVASADAYQEVRRKLYVAYEEACNRSGLVDFGELLLRAHELWLNNDNLLQHYQHRFRHVLVDEFQDINTIQYAWLRVLAGTGGNLTVVGDDDQSIYGWRGAKVENIQQFHQDYPATEMIKLEQNYRSTSNILNAANAVIDHNENRLGKKLWTEGDAGDPIDVYAAVNENDESRFVADDISKLIEGGENPSDIAILYRSNAQSRVLEESLIHRQIPYRIFGGQRFYDRMEVKNVLAYMRLIANRHDDTAMERVINTPTRGIGGKTVDSLRALARQEGCSFWQSAHLAVKHNLLASRAKTAVAQFIQLIEDLDDFTKDMTLDDLTHHVLDTSGLIDHHKKEKDGKGEVRVENMQELVTAAKNFQWDEELTSALDAFLDEASLDAGENQAADHESSINLMTLHSAKGLEFRYVFLVGMEENLFPHKMSLDEIGGLEEERRLAYVGITRAMIKLCLTYADSRRIFGTENFNRPSRFIREIPSELIHEVRLQTQIRQPFTARSRESETQLHEVSQSALEKYGIRLGQRVNHPLFGEGVVVTSEGDGGNAAVEINFDGHGAKKLMLQYAKLEPLD